jgi:hypothetical protein
LFTCQATSDRPASQAVPPKDGATRPEAAPRSSPRLGSGHGRRQFGC